jgi:hypothetical protein
MLMQQRYAPYFLAITIQRRPNIAGQTKGAYEVVYGIEITTHYGVQLNLEIAV